MTTVDTPLPTGKVRRDVSQRFNNFSGPIRGSLSTQDGMGEVREGPPEDWGGGNAIVRETEGGKGEGTTHRNPATQAGGAGGDFGPPGTPLRLGDDRGDDGDDGKDDDRESDRLDNPADLPPVPDIPMAHARVTAAITSYWAAVDAFAAIPRSTFQLDGCGDIAAGLAIDRVHQGKRRATAELIASIRGYADAMDATQGEGGRPSNWPMFPDERDGRLYFAGDGPGGARGDDGVAVVRLSGWACRAVGKMAGKGCAGNVA